MVDIKTDQELLREYTERGSGGAFQALVERHVDLVFATALRGASDPGTAQEITQNIFIALARKAHWLRGETSLAGWLHKSALLEVRRWWRGELRRQRREQAAVELGTTMKNEDSLLKNLKDELDEGLLSLPEGERQALMLRYFEGRTHREIGLLLGAREDAARMRTDKALNRLTRFFRLRGYTVAATATTAAILGSAAQAAPVGLAALVTHNAVTAGSAGAATGLKLFIAKFMGLTKTQTAVLCAVIVAMPVTWEWNINRMASQHAALTRTKLAAVRDQQDKLSAESGRLRAEFARLDAALLEAAENQTRYDAVASKLAAMKAQVHDSLTNSNYRWPENSPYVRIPKETVKSLDMLHRSPTPFGTSGAITEPALEMLAITPQEKGPAEKALGDYWRGVNNLSAAGAYETNLPDTQAGRLTKTVIIPPLGQPLKDLAQNTSATLSGVLGADREQLLFGDWDQGAIEIFSPGNLWNISERPQNLEVWVEPTGGTNGTPRYGSGWHFGFGGTSSEGPWSLQGLPAPIVAKFFTPWLQQFGINNSIPNE